MPLGVGRDRVRCERVANVWECGAIIDWWSSWTEERDPVDQPSLSVTGV